MQPTLPVEPVYVWFTAEIVPHTTESLLGVFARLVNEGRQRVHLLLSTPGGSVMHGLTIYNVLRGLPLELVTHNVGNVDSIGNAVFLAGARRYACPHSTFMFHGVGIQPQGAQRFEGKALRELLDKIGADEKRIGSIIAERTRITPDQIDALFREAQTKDAAFAVGAGIVDEVRDIQIPAGATVVSLVFQR